MKTIRFGFSPCPNDTIQFHAMVHGLIDTHGYKFEPVMADVEELNRMALGSELELTKVSYGVLGKLLPDYWCLRTGGALGRGCGPLWVARGNTGAAQLARSPIAHPGVNTTAYLLTKLRLGDDFDGVSMLFSDIMEAVTSGEVPSGIIIHEGRFTYADKGLTKIEDLGQWWERETGLPIPLGCIVLKRELEGVDPALIQSIMRESLRFAKENPAEATAWVREHAQELDEEVIESHIGLYVNEFSEDIGEEGERAVRELLARQRAIEPELANWTGDLFPPA